MNPDLPLHETYPFAKAARQVAKALDPQMLKETAFSEASNIPVAHTREGASSSLEGTTQVKMLQDEQRHKDVNGFNILLVSTGQLTQEPSI